MRATKRAVAAAMLLGGLSLGALRAEAMPVAGMTAPIPHIGAEQVYYGYYPGYGWRRPFYRRRFYGYGYGWRRPYVGRGYGPGWHNRRFIGSRAR